MTPIEARTYSPSREGARILPPTSFAAQEHREDIVRRHGKIDFTRFSASLARVFNLEGNPQLDIYNPSASFINPPNRYRAVRVDAPDGRTKTVFFSEDTDGNPIKLLKDVHFDLEDPQVSNIAGEVVLVGVEVHKQIGKNGQIEANWKTVGYRGKTIGGLRRFFESPESMKDIRPVERPNGKIGVYTRPRSPGNEALGGDGQIGYTEFASLDEWENSPKEALDIKHAPLIAYRFPEGEWGGVNHVQIVKYGKYIGWNLALTHRAYKDERTIHGKVQWIRHYYAGALLHNPNSEEVIDLGVIATRGDFPAGRWKDQKEGHDKQDIAFLQQLILLNEKDAEVKGGISDAEIHWLEIANPLQHAA